MPVPWSTMLPGNPENVTKGKARLQDVRKCAPPLCPGTFRQKCCQPLAARAPLHGHRRRSRTRRSSPGPTERGSDSSAAPHRAPRSLCAHRSPRQTLSWPAGLRRPLVWPPGWRVHPRGLRPATPAKRVGPERAAGGECPSPRQRRRLRLTHLRAQRKRSDVFPHASK